MRGRLRQVGRLAHVLLVVALGLLMASLLVIGRHLGIKASLARRQRWTRLFMRRLVAALPFDVCVRGKLPSSPMLWVSNHVSWTDIPLLGMLAPVSFLSKAEVRHWPLAGWLAEQAGTLFIKRGASDGQQLRVHIGQRLVTGHPLLLFPEGTTTDGHQLGTFHGRLLAAAIDQGIAVQPVAIQYQRRGQIDPFAPFVRDDDLLSHLLRLLAQPRGQVRIHLLEPLASHGKGRTLLGLQAQRSIHQALYGTPEPPALRRQCATAA